MVWCGATSLVDGGLSALKPLHLQLKLHVEAGGGLRRAPFGGQRRRARRLKGVEARERGQPAGRVIKCHIAC